MSSVITKASSRVRRSLSFMSADKVEEGEQITDSLFIPGQCSDRQVVNTCFRNLCCVHQHRKYCICMHCDAPQHEIRHQSQMVNFCLDQAEADEELNNEKHMNHMKQWSDFCFKHPYVRYMCINGIELKQTVQIVKILLYHYQNTLTCLNLAPFCTSRLPLTQFTFPNLMYLTIERIDNDALSQMLPKLPQLRGIYASKSDFTGYVDLPDGVQFIVESYCNLEHKFYRSLSSQSDRSCEEILSDARIIVLNGGPVPADAELMDKRNQAARFVTEKEGMKFLGFESYVKHGDTIRQQKVHHGNYMLEMVYDDAVMYLSEHAASCRLLRISNAELSANALRYFAKLTHLKILHISLYYGGEDFSLDPVIEFVKDNVAHKSIRKFELFGNLIMTKDQQRSLFKLSQKRDLFVYVYSHHTCLWWLMDQELDDAIRMDGLCVYRVVSKTLPLDSIFVDRLKLQKESLTTSTEEVLDVDQLPNESDSVSSKLSRVETSIGATSTDTMIFKNPEYSSDEESVQSVSDGSRSDDNSSTNSVATIIDRDEFSELPHVRKVRFSSVDLVHEVPPDRHSTDASTESSSTGSHTFCRVELDENGKFVEPVEQDTPATEAITSVADLANMEEGIGAMIEFEGNDGDAAEGDRVIDNYSISPHDASFWERLLYGIRGCRCIFWNLRPKKKKKEGDRK